MIEIGTVPVTEKTNNFTVSPVDKETNIRFQKFRTEDVRDQFIFGCLFQTVTLAWRLTIVINERNTSSVVLLAIQFIVTTLYWSLYLFQNRLKGHFMTGLIVLMVLYHLMILVAGEFISQSDDERFIFGKVMLLITVATNIMILTPTISHACFLYLPLYLLTTLFNQFRHSDNKYKIIQAVYASICCLVFWFIYQKRELKRFYEKERAELKEEKAVEKESELEAVLNLQ